MKKEKSKARIEKGYYFKNAKVNLSNSTRIIGIRVRIPITRFDSIMWTKKLVHSVFSVEFLGKYLNISNEYDTSIYERIRDSILVYTTNTITKVDTHLNDMSYTHSFAH